MTIRKSLTAACLAGIIALPAAAESASPHTITVTGHGEAKAAPDSAMVSAGVTTQAKTAAAALSENSAAMNRVFAALKRLGVEAKNIQTSNFTVSPQFTPYNSNSGNGQRIVGYQVSNQVDVTLERTAGVGPAVDALVAAGANQMNGIGFTIHDPKPLLASARAAAVDDAAARAQVFAKAAHVALGPILSIEEGAARCLCGHSMRCARWRRRHRRPSPPANRRSPPMSRSFGKSADHFAASSASIWSMIRFMRASSAW